jgi:hypothetical protein
LENNFLQGSATAGTAKVFERTEWVIAEFE